MDVAIVGASGACGRMIATHLLADRVLEGHERLQLVGRRDGPSARSLLGLRVDLQDAFGGTCPELDVALGPEGIAADVVVFAAGKTFKPLDAKDPRASLEAMPTRDDVAAVNLTIFEAYADGLARLGAGHEIALVLSNPVELGVEIFSQRLGPHRVIGIGGHSDSLRFRQEIASEIGIRRQMVSGFMLGEHGTGMIPAWSTVNVHGMDPAEVRDVIRTLRGGTELRDFPERLRRAIDLMREYVASDDPQRSFRFVNSQPPDIRAYLTPWAAQMAGGLTANMTAMVTVDMIKTILSGREVVVTGQVQLDGEVYGLRGPLGVPVVITPQGWTQAVSPPLWDEEIRLLKQSSAQINKKVRRWRRGG